jgi:hypothetical protein
LKFFAIIKLGAVWFDAKISIGTISIQAPKNWLSIGWLPNFLASPVGLPKVGYQTSLPILYQLSNFGFAKKLACHKQHLAVKQACTNPMIVKT